MNAEPEDDEHETGDPLEQELIREETAPDERGSDAGRTNTAVKPRTKGTLATTTRLAFPG